MTDSELKNLKDNLWHAADVLRAGAHLAANKYGQPILGLIFLRYADILYKQHKAEIEAEYNKSKGTRAEKSIKDISIKHCGFYLPPEAYYTTINDAPDDANKATLVKKAMEAIERENEKMDGVLPKEVYGQLVPEEEPELLSNIMRIFMDIPENISVDLFGEIYEFFLGEFALQEGKDGGTFYTPATVVRYMVEVLQPQNGEKKILDPACGSGGMFVQAARFMHRHNKTSDEVMKFRCYGVEKEPDTVKLAKMNLLLNNVRGEIVEANSFYSDPYNAVGNFDYVMANPPFNVDEVVYDKVKDDPRFNIYGVPKNKSKTAKKGSDKKVTVPNANYLWISYFASSLNQTGKAALVMANSIRGEQVMLDFELAEIYGYETKRFNEQVKNNIERFDDDFRFQLTDDEFNEILRSKNSTSSWGGTRYKPYAFTEQGIYMLMTVLKGELAVAQSKMLIRMFKEMKHFLQNNANIFAEINTIKQNLLDTNIHQKEADKRIDELFTLMDKYKVEEKQGIFFQGQIFDAYAKFESFIAQAKKEIVLIDGYVDLSILERLAKKKKGVQVTIYTAPKTPLTAQDIQKFNAQYPALALKHTTKMHDRFLIIDGKTLYHIGASLKDLGKKCFAFELLDSSLITAILQNV